MPITGQFLADFSSFQKAVQDAELELKGMESSAVRVETAMQKMVDRFDGRRVIQEATQLTSVIKDLGGVSRLTEAEQARVNATVNEAIAKYRALGQEAPQAMRDLANATKGAGEPTVALGINFTKLTASIFSAEAAMQVLKGAFDLAKQAVAAVIDEIGRDIKAASDAEAAHMRVAAALQTQGTNVPSVIDAYQRYADQLQQTTIYSDDMVEAAQGILVLVGNVMPRDMERALKATTDLASGLRIDLTAAAEMVARAAEGNTKVLKQHGVELDANKVKTEGFDYVLTQISSKWSGQAAAAANTFSGRLAQMSNEWNNVQESIGNAIIKNATVQEVIGTLTGSIRDLNTSLQDQKRVQDFVSDATTLAVRTTALFANALALAAAGSAGLAVSLGLLLNETLRGVRVASALGIAWAYADEIMSISTGKFRNHGDVIKALTAIQGTAAQKQQDLGKAVGESTQFLATAAGEAKRLADSANALADRLDVTRGQTVALNNAAKESPEAWRRQTRAMEDSADAAAKKQKVDNDLLKTEKEWAGFISKSLNVTLDAFLGKIGEATMYMPPHLVAARALEQEYRQLSGELREAVVAMAATKRPASEIATDLIKSSKLTEDNRAAIENLVEQLRKEAAELGRSAKALKDYNATLAQIFYGLKTYKLTLDPVVIAERDLRESTVALNPEFKRAADMMLAGGKSASYIAAALKDATGMTDLQRAALQRYLESLDDFQQSVAAAADAFAKLVQIMGGLGPVGDILGSAFGTMNAGFATVNSLEKAFGKLDERFGAFFVKNKKVLNDAVVGMAVGTAAGQALANAGLGFQIAGTAAATAVTWALGGMTMGLSTAVMAVYNMVAAWRADKEAARQANAAATEGIMETRAQLIQQYGSLENIGYIGRQVGVDLAGMWGSGGVIGAQQFARTLETFNQKVKVLDEATQKFGLTWRDLRVDKQIEFIANEAAKLEQQLLAVQNAGYDFGKYMKAAAPALNELLAAALETGAKLPPSMQSYIETLIRTKQLTEDNAKALLGLAVESGVPSLDQIADAASRYGLELDKLGGKVPQLRITEQANQIAKDFEVMTAAGIPFNEIIGFIGPKLTDTGEDFDKLSKEAQAAYLEAGGTITDTSKGMLESIQNMVNQATGPLGLTLPASMEPIIKQLIESGKLVDANGEKLSGLGNIKFEVPLVDKIDDLIDALNRLVGVTDDPTNPNSVSASTDSMAFKGAKNWEDLAKKAKEGYQPQIESVANAVGGSSPSSLQSIFAASTRAMLDDWSRLTRAAQDYGRTVGGLPAPGAGPSAPSAPPPSPAGGTSAAAYAFARPASMTLAAATLTSANALLGGSYRPNLVVTINNPVVRNDGDIEDLVDEVVRRVPGALLGGGRF